MKRMAICVLVCFLMVGMLALPASAESGATKAELYCTVNSDGDCLVRLTVNFHMESSSPEMVFPLPPKATNITMNGASVATTGGKNAIYAAVGTATNGMVGDFTVWFDYTVPGAVKVNDKKNLQLDLPMLCGFDYPVNLLTFAITLPGDVTNKPNFVSTYQQIGFESNLDLSVKDNIITGTTRTGLNDHEYVSMSMEVPRDMFPSVSTYQRSGNPEIIPMGICAALAVLYWFWKLRTLPPIRTRTTTPPAGVSAGELGSRLTMSGGDLTTLVLSWAQMGYLLIQADNHRVVLHKRMDMGNERSGFEIKTFRALFENRRVVDCTGSHYAQLLRRTASVVPAERIICRRTSGNRKIFRGLLCLGMVFCGICVAMNMTGIFALQILFSVLFGLFGLISAWQMQKAAFSMHSRKKSAAWIALAELAVWVLLGAICKQITIPAVAAVVQILAGYLMAYGGMRTDRNRVECSEILGLRHYLRHISQAEAARLNKIDPEYFFRMAPYAIALGVGPKFAAAFGRQKMEQCPYLVTRVHGSRPASEWMRLMLQTVSIMDERARRNELEKWLAIRVK